MRRGGESRWCFVFLFSRSIFHFLGLVLFFAFGFELSLLFLSILAVLFILFYSFDCFVFSFIAVISAPFAVVLRPTCPPTYPFRLTISSLCHVLPLLSTSLLLNAPWRSTRGSPCSFWPLFSCPGKVVRGLLLEFLLGCCRGGERHCCNTFVKNLQVVQHTSDCFNPWTTLSECRRKVCFRRCRLRLLKSADRRSFSKRGAG